MILKESVNYNELEGDIQDYCEDLLFDMDVYIDEIWLHGSRIRGNAREDSDLDAVMFYYGTEREDNLFNILHEESFTLDGVEVDINPVNIRREADKEAYKKRSQEYDKEVMGEDFYGFTNDWCCIPTLTEGEKVDINRELTSLDNIDVATVNGKCPVEDFLRSITDEKLLKKIFSDICILSLINKRLIQVTNTDKIKYIADGIYELRTHQSSNISRVFYFTAISNKIVLLSGYIKKQQKLNRDEFNKAKQIMNEYLKNN